ncbi:quinone oxidoreductase family protein [Chitinophaga qingshengii]|uniref:Zinc-binding dehydrogenase n=1 Tax=Chitinophaga qingshengii TaxID=1569794 RepID=A0ABR7TSJ2_9BACT|nr:zinc-binding dehydrogenase [Chitinophaga qingshengii]MBC9933000.1 zinc-binding dehydrogenase [Chitinophaga qingshengii]
MKAVTLHAYGAPEVLQVAELPMPHPAPQEVIVKVQAVAVNYADLLVRQGVYPMIQQFPAILPGEISGVITATGSEVQHLQPGQRVSGYAPAGYAAYAAMPVAGVIVLPEAVVPAQGLLTQSLTAQHLLEQTSGYRSVVITAAGGGVGSQVVQLARIKGIPQIIALTGSAAKQQYVRSLGATHAINYRDSDWLQQLTNITGPQGADLILDATGGDTPSRLVTALAVNGTLIIYGNSSAQPSSVNPRELIMKSARVVGSTVYNIPPVQRQQWTDYLVQLIATGQLTSKVNSYPFTEAALAHQDVENRHNTGKTVLTFPD